MRHPEKAYLQIVGREEETKVKNTKYSFHKIEEEKFLNPIKEMPNEV